ncbi:hypothetical protein ACFFX0_32205 [Citricoccus parietis]|uniref:Uncharacterized protein n=1 Tax=Citricoccus parietis TaxID=592307 RepID=A0ABV5G9F5_9MICC
MVPPSCGSMVGANPSSCRSVQGYGARRHRGALRVVQEGDGGAICAVRFIRVPRQASLPIPPTGTHHQGSRHGVTQMTAVPPASDPQVRGADGTARWQRRRGYRLVSYGRRPENTVRFRKRAGRPGSAPEMWATCSGPTPRGSVG